MASTSSSTNRTIDAYAANGEWELHLSLPNATDSEVLALAQAIKSLPWPSTYALGTISANRTEFDNTQYVGNLAATPPVFS